ncbi:hypothetical protein P0D68_03170 [Paraburkholderia sp. RL17-380-BIE-A]|uniref:hypothetical protein n=1 Tax=Paraburkholderia sp. RL17-380-BIE-A TaxID=3031630 RepID=UPI0038BC34CB
MSRGDISRLLQLLGIPAGCAAVGLLLGRAFRGKPSMVESMRWRLVTSAAYLRDAHNSSLSPHTRFKCAFDAMYFCFCEIAGARGIDVEGMVHPNAEILGVGMSALITSSHDRLTVERLMEWAADSSPFLPQIPLDEACRLAARVNADTLAIFAQPRTTGDPAGER